MSVSIFEAIECNSMQLKATAHLKATSNEAQKVLVPGKAASRKSFCNFYLPIYYDSLS